MEGAMEGDIAGEPVSRVRLWKNKE